MRRTGFSLGRIFGIRIRIDWSWLFIFALITWNLASAFGDLHSDWSVRLNLTVAIVGALLFFASVLAHELAHSLVAQAQGTGVDSITLFLFGGVSNIQEEPKSPGNEFLMAILGPVTSIVIGGVLVTAASLMASPRIAFDAPASDLIARLGPITTLFLWLGSVNIFLGLFNLIPGFPLDGGRVVRSIFWAVTKDLRRATHWASLLGQGVAWVMILAGIASAFGAQVPLIGASFVGGLWLAFIGWFLSSAATQSYQRIVVEDILDDVSVSRMMRSDPPIVPSGISLSEFVEQHVMQSDDYGFPVVENGELQGIITLDDVRSVGRDAWERTRVAQAMTPSDRLLTVAPDDCASEALEKLTHQDVRQLPVLDQGKLVGVVRRRDITRWLHVHSDLSRPSSGRPQEGRGI
jgi:Zn-dependent protease/predicted transcriptional regulator